MNSLFLTLIMVCYYQETDKGRAFFQMIGLVSIRIRLEKTWRLWQIKKSENTVPVVNLLDLSAQQKIPASIQRGIMCLTFCM